MSGICRAAARVTGLAAVFCLVLVHMAVLPFRSANATIIQYAYAEFRDGSGFMPVLDRIVDPVDAVTDTVTANLLGPFGMASASAGVFGDVGMQARQTSTGFLSTDVGIQNDFIPNFTGTARRGVLRFIIDGGEMEFVAGQGSSLQFNLSVAAAIYSATGEILRSIFWVSDILMRQTQDGLDVAFSGRDIGATRTAPGSFMVSIPLSFQSFDLGTIPSGGYVDVAYRALFESNVSGFAEVVNWQFSDPLSVDDTGRSPALTLLDDVTPIPEPGMALLFAGGMAVALRLARRRRTA